jgi:CubicO group peptidase (beta-lactamase class C family)
MASTYFWIDPVEDIIAIQMTQLMPSSTYPIRPQLQQLVYAAIEKAMV